VTAAEVTKAKTANINRQLTEKQPVKRRLTPENNTSEGENLGSDGENNGLTIGRSISSGFGLKKEIESRRGGRR